MLLILRQQTFTLQFWKWIDNTIPLCRVVLLVSEPCLRGIIMNWPFKVYKTLKSEHVTRKAGFLWQVYKPLSYFWSETVVPLKIAEPNQPTTDNAPWDRLTTRQTVAVLSINQSLPNYSCRSHYYRHTTSVNMQILLDISVARIQSAHNLWECHIALIPEVTFSLILLGWSVVASLVFLLLYHNMSDMIIEGNTLGIY